MSTEIEVKKEGQLAERNWEQELAQYAKAETAKVDTGGNNISTRAGILSYKNQALPNNLLPCVIVDSVHENAYYTDKFDPDKPKAPVCFALFGEGDEAKPHPDAAEPQAESCAKCPHNQWGSAGGNRRGKACKNVLRLALVPEGAEESAEKMLGAEIALLKVPPTSVKNYATYVQKTAALYKRPPFAVVTHVSTKPDAKTQFQILFDVKAGGLIPVEILPAVLEKRELARDTLYRPYDYNEVAEAATEQSETRRKF